MREKSQRLKDADAKVTALREQFDAALAERDAILTQEAGISIGGLVRDRQGREWKVCRVNSGTGVYGYAKKKNGSWGGRPRYVGIAGFNVDPIDQVAAAKA